MAKKKKKKRVFKVRNIMILFMILLGIGIFVYYVLMLPVKNVYISGNSIVLDDEIMKLSTLDTYPSFLLTKSSFLKEKIEENPYIQNVSVKKGFGNVIEIIVEEYQPIAMMDQTLILSNGMDLENIYNLMDIPILIQKPEDVKIYKNFARKFSKLDSHILRQISEIEYSPVSVDDERFLLYMNDGNLVYVTLTKISKLNKYDRIRDKLGDKKGIIYLDSGDYMEVKR